VFIFLVALGIDYNIFLMTRVREETLRIGTRPGILRGLTVTGGVITSAGFVLAATFAVLTTLPLTQFLQIGFAVAFGVLLDTLLGAHGARPRAVLRRRPADLVAFAAGPARSGPGAGTRDGIE
jgi:RND superfamily putative drug exporter